MTFATLAVRSAFRNRLRMLLTAAGVAMAIISFLFLRTMIEAYYVGVEAGATDRLVVRNKISITFSLPLAYATKIKAIPGVTDIGWSNWFGGVYKEPKNFFGRLATDAESLLRLYPEMLLTDEEKRSWLADRTGCIIGEGLARKYGWKLGDEIPIRGDIYPGDWKFVIRGIYRGRDKSTDVQSMYFHWKYLDESMPERRKNQAGIFILKTADANHSTQVGQKVDELFANSPAETRTETEKAFQLEFLSMSGTILTAIKWVSGVMLLILMLVLGNTMAMSTRERTSEYAVMRSIGFRPRHIIALVLGEGATVALLGFAVSVVLAPAILRGFADLIEANVGSFLGNFELSKEAVALAGVAALIGGLVATGVPALRAGRLSIVDALRRVE